MSEKTDLYIDGELVGTCKRVKSASHQIDDETYYSYRVEGFEPLKEVNDGEVVLNE